MPQLILSQLRSLASDLRDHLDRAERLVVQVDAGNVVTLLTLLDQIEQQFAQLSDSGLDLRPEETRWDSLLQRIDSQPQKIVRAAHVAGGMPALRTEHAVDDHFWWHLDEALTRRRARAVRRAVITLVLIVVAVVGGIRAVEFLFPPDPEAVAMVETSGAIGNLMTEGRWDEALAVVQEARSRFPNQPELAVWEAVILEHLGRTDEAAALLDTVQGWLADNPIQFWVLLGNSRMTAGDLDGAESAAQQGLALSPDEPQIVFLMGNIAEARGDIVAAIDYFDRTFYLAQDSEPQLAVIARVRMGQLMQRSSMFSSPVTAPAQ